MRAVILATSIVLAPEATKAADPAPRVAAIDAVSQAVGFSGIVGVRKDGGLVHLAAYGRPDVGADSRSPARSVRWASVTKLVTAILVLQEAEAGRIDLDAPVSLYLPDWPVNGAATIRQLLRHRSGLANPDSQPDADGDGMPDVYQGAGPDWRTVCAGTAAGMVGAPFSYNNCDYWVLGAALEAVTGQTYGELVSRRIRDPLALATLAPAKGVRVEAWDGDRPEPRVDPAAYGPGADLYGTVEDMLSVDQALMDGRLISAASREAMFEADPQSNQSGLSVWRYPMVLKACGDLRVMVVERQGAVGGVQVRNLMIPERNIAVVAWSNDGATDFGQTWAGTGLAVDLLAAAACGAVPAPSAA